MELIKIREKEGKQLVSARDLHDFLDVESKYQDWITRMIEYGFVENIDFAVVNQPSQKKEGSRMVTRNLEVHVLSIDMAKEISMIQRTEKGKEARQYFIKCENKLKQIQVPQTYAAALLEAGKLALALENEKNKRVEAEKFQKLLATSYNSVLVRELAKMCCKNGINIGEKRLWGQLRDWGMVFRNSTEPMQKHLDSGIFEVVTKIIETGNKNRTVRTTRVTGKGQQYIIKKLLEVASSPTKD